MKCKECNKEENKLRRNMCGACYGRWLYANSPSFKASRMKSAKKWKKANPERNRAIVLKAVTKYNALHRDAINTKKRERWANDPEYREQLKADHKKYLDKLKVKIII